MDYRELCIDKQISIRDALYQMDKALIKVLFITDCDHLMASLTDGDIRRYLLAGGSMDSPVSVVGNPNPITARNKTQAISLLQEHHCIAVPLVDEKNKLSSIVLEKEDAVSVPFLGLPVVIMAGGKGTRLDPYTRILPKPLIPIGDLPIIEHIMGRFQEYGCKDFHIIVNYKRELIKAYFAENERHYQISWYDEDKPLGTGGGLSLLKGKLKDTFILTNCDIILQSDYADMLRFHREGGNVITMVGAKKNLTIPYGTVETGVGGVIEGFREKPELSFLTNTGLYVVEPEVLEDIPVDTALGFPDIIESQRQKGRRTAVYTVDDDEWLDMGQLEELKKMEERLRGE